MNKKNILVAVGLILVVILIIVFSSKNKNSSNEGKEVVFGALAPLTGQISVLGERMRNGMELARTDAIAQGKIKNLTIKYEDACDGKSSLAATKKLIEQDNVPVIGSGFCLFGLDAVIPTVTDKKVILFNTAANPESVLNKDYVFSTNFAIRDDASKLAEYASKKLGAKTVAIIHLDTSFGESYRKNFTETFESLGGKVISADAKAPSASDFKTEMTKIASAKPDVVVVIHFGSSLGNALKQAREAGVKSVIMGDYESEDPTVLEFAGPAAEGLIISSSQPEVKTNKVVAFEKAYKEKYGQDPDVLAANAYDALTLQIMSYQKCNGDTSCMVKDLKEVKNFDGVSGNITINNDHSVTKSTIFKIVKGGKFVELK